MININIYSILIFLFSKSFLGRQHIKVFCFEMSVPFNGPRQCLVVMGEEPFCVVQMSETIFGYSSDELYGQSILALCGPWTDSLLLFCAISEACVMKSKSVEVFLRDKVGRKRFCKVSCSPAEGRSGYPASCILLFEVIEQRGQDMVVHTATADEANRPSTSLSWSQRQYSPLHSIKDSAIFKEMLQYQGRMKMLVPNLVFDSSSTISIPRLLAGPERAASIRPRRKRTMSTRRQPRHGTLNTASPTNNTPGPAPALDAPLSSAALPCPSRQREEDRSTARRHAQRSASPADSDSKQHWGQHSAAATAADRAEP